MSGSFENLDVPPTLVSFAVTTGKVQQVVSPEFKAPGHTVVLIAPEQDENGLPQTDSLLKVFETVTQLLHTGKAVSCYTLGMGGIAEAVLKMAIGNGIGLTFNDNIADAQLFGYGYGSFLLELTEDVAEGVPVGGTTQQQMLTKGAEQLNLQQLQNLYEEK